MPIYSLLKYQLIRDYSSLSKRTKIIAGVANAILGMAVMVYIDTTMGVNVADSLFRVLIVLVFSMVFLFAYGLIMKRRAKKEELK